MEKNLKPIGALLADSWTLYKKHANIFALICVIPFLFFCVKLVLAPYLYNVFGQPVSIAAFAVVAVFGLLYLVFMVVLPFAMSLAVHETEQGNIPSMEVVYKKAFSSVWSYLCVVLLSVVIIFGGSILFIVPGIIASIYLSLAIYAYIFDGKSGIDALVTSAWYVRNFWWDILARKITLAILVVLSMVIFSLIAVPILFALGFNPIIFQFLFYLFVFIFILPFCYTFFYLIYKDVKHAQIARKGTHVPEKAFLLIAEKFYIILITVAAVGAVALFLLVNLEPPMQSNHYGMMMRHYISSPYQY